jgi:hypothetical protein
LFARFNKRFADVDFLAHAGNLEKIFAWRNFFLAKISLFDFICLVTRQTTMNEPTETTSPTRIEFDLAKVLTAEELAKFKAAAQAAGAASLTEHFLNITLRVPHPKAA